MEEWLCEYSCDDTFTKDKIYTTDGYGCIIDNKGRQRIPPHFYKAIYYRFSKNFPIQENE